MAANYTSYQYKRAYLIAHILSRINRFFPHSPLSSATVEIMGIRFPNSVGLAAGFDRYARFLPYTQRVGFGFIEIGTINVNASKTPDSAVLATLDNLKKATKYSKNSVQRRGISLGSLHDGLTKQTEADFANGMMLFWPYADYLVINLSRPNSPTRNPSLEPKALTSFLTNIKRDHSQFASEFRRYVPIVAKVAIDHECNEHIPEILLSLKAQQFDGAVIAFENWPDISRVADYVSQLKSTNEDFPLIVVGGIRSCDDIEQLMAAGASLVQVFSSLITQGPLRMQKMISNY
ncbi:hypothetical protein Q7A_456 [Methylophaga nitratireducenticrescens]|nr:hypothetical protein [Methylophaga nitratireducenticrescens]AFI83307.2 hypothetical protein Q7A_456 [Methylophaga nitratireducenticrescens]AUZ83431.1 hypothetical protein CDW43_02050 [Methylophaga nitratireducenticrescens]